MTLCPRLTSLLALSLLAFAPGSARADDTADGSAPPPSAQTADPSPAPAPSSEKATRKRKRKRPRREGFLLETRLWGGAGAMHGQRERRLDAARLELDLRLEPSWSAGELELSLPVDFTHRETIGAALRETRGSGSLQARYRLVRELRLGAALGVGAVYRPDWPDLYQPTGDGLESTDRYSYWDRHAELDLTVHPGRHHWLRAAYGYELADYSQDPAFDPVARPDHLTPFDQEQQSAALGYRFSTRSLKLGLAVAGSVKRYFFAFARDAHTGSTHAGPNGPPPNPLLELHGLTPALEFELAPAGSRFELELRYEHEFQADVFQGYLSFAGPHPSFELRWTPWRPLALRAGVALWWRRYGSGSYRSGSGHPPLDSGDRRYDHRLQTSAGAELRIARHIALTLDARHVVRDTNFPDYVPFEFPMSQRYAIDWDYTNLLVMLGLEWRAGWL